eukprot:3025635-Rhodomonas_salina.1
MGLARTSTSHFWVNSAICLRACYAMSGTDIVYGAIYPRVCYAMSGCYAILGTELAYAAMRCLILSSRMVLPRVRCYQSTELAYAATV